MRWRIYVRAATACARSASGAKDAGISAATTPGSQSAIVVSTSSPPLSAVMAVSLSGATAADAVMDGMGCTAGSGAGPSVTTSHGITSESTTSSSDSRKTLRTCAASFLPCGGVLRLDAGGKSV